MSRWKCNICGYEVDGEQPPDICPVCGAPKSAFIKVDEAIRQLDLKKILISLHLHPISAHLPNGLLPVILLFLLIYFITDNMAFEKTIFYLNTVVALTTPFTFAAGILDWHLRYDRVIARIFTEKIILSLILLTITLPVMLMRILYPDILISLSKLTWVYVCGILLQTCLVIRLGYLGGKLVFGH